MHDVEDYIFVAITRKKVTNDVFTLIARAKKDDDDDDDDDDDERKEEQNAALIEFTRYDVGHVAHLPGRPET